MQNLENIAGHILNKFQGNITPMKLQKLLYYVKVWTTVAGKKTISNTPDQAFYAWKYGPVNPEIYHEYKGYGKNPIKDIPLFSPIPSNEKKLINFIVDSYGCYNAITLSKTTHTEEPWIKNQEFGGKISDEEILDYYSKESFAQNFPLDKDNKFYPPKTTSHHAYVFDMAEDDEATNVYFDSLDEYLDEFNKASKEAHLFMNSNTEIFG
ncbi:hypothetical protein CK503_04190 [Aliifodinibius salipaludis]|uniref:Antitoxin SocA-like Panacea domain-containing protein n=2 Tax=Fodinibius salipaludis TaxID=2032627 RepID=A0A2A2GET4_9BACT|nr:hypothetical protein CK503_04190 [Aliifodinibius salipaludis]